jgi:hypothetical protein
MIVIANDWLPTDPLKSVTFTVNVYPPIVVGVPLITPVLPLSVKPGANVPDANANVYGEVPPDAEIVTEYKMPVVPSGSDWATG